MLGIIEKVTENCQHQNAPIEIYATSAPGILHTVLITTLEKDTAD